MPLRLFASRVRTGAAASRLLYMATMIGFFYFLSQYLQEALGFSPLQAGLAFLPMTLVNFAVAVLSPRISRRLGDILTLTAGIVLTLAGTLTTGLLCPRSGSASSRAHPRRPPHRHRRRVPQRARGR